MRLLNALAFVDPGRRFGRKASVHYPDIGAERKILGLQRIDELTDKCPHCNFNSGLAISMRICQPGSAFLLNSRGRTS